MEMTFTTRQQTTVIGYAFDTTAFSPEIGAAWCRVHENGDFQRLMGKSKCMENFGLCIMKEGMADGGFRYMIGFDYDETKPVDDDMELYELAGGEYAVFPSPSMEEISNTFKYVYEQWLPASQYEYDKARDADFEYYYMRGEEVACDIYVPLRLKG